MLKTLGKTTWEEIEVGEIFALHCCWCIFYKNSESDWMLLESDWQWEDVNFYGHIGNILSKDSFQFDRVPIENLYKLPLSVQRLWRED